MSSANIREEVISSEYFLDGIDDNLREEAIKDFARVKDKFLAAYYKARGFVYRGVERVRMHNPQGRKKDVIVICFDGKNATRRALLEFYSNDDHKTYNVNGKLLISELKNINTIIANFY